ncbi:hypothetical protein N0V95_000943 [Ascochyta clinopodiicola]|nr:hypothetical protein N0V95_000943 [Ascochyta clinopodiicola]
MHSAPAPSTTSAQFARPTDRTMLPPETPDSTVSKYIRTIAHELTEVLPATKMAEFNIPDANVRMSRKRSQIEARILKLASNITNAKYAAKSYSSFHVWEAFRHVNSKRAARAVAPDLAASMHPFGNCLTMGSECAEELRTALEVEGPEYAEYVSRVQFVTNNWNQHARSAREYHCMVIIRLPTQCIVVDAVNCDTAFAVPLGEMCVQPGCPSIGLVYVASGDARLLVECGPVSPCYTLARPYSHGEFEYDDPYSDIKDGLVGGVENLAYPSKNYHVRGKLPSRCSTFVHQVWEQKPSFDHTDLATGTGFAVETCLIRVNFAKRKITVELIPYTDWLMRPENAELLERLRRRGEVNLSKDGETFANVKVDLDGQGTHGFDAKTAQSLELLDVVCGKLGMPEGEISRIAGVMQEVWTEHDEAKARQADRQRKEVFTQTKRVDAKLKTQPCSREDGKTRRSRTSDSRQVPY